MTTYIYAENGTRKTRFTAMVWKHMGKNKNGWTEISKAQYEGKAPTGKSDEKPADLADETRYRQLYDQAKGFEADGKLAEAKGKYEEALALKSSPTLKGKITKMGKTIEAAAKNDNRKELIEMAEAALVENDFETALESYAAAQEIEETLETKNEITKVEKAQADAMVD